MALRGHSVPFPGFFTSTRCLLFMTIVTLIRWDELSMNFYSVSAWGNLNSCFSFLSCWESYSKVLCLDTRSLCSPSVSKFQVLHLSHCSISNWFLCRWDMAIYLYLLLTDFQFSQNQYWVCFFSNLGFQSLNRRLYGGGCIGLFLGPVLLSHGLGLIVSLILFLLLFHCIKIWYQVLRCLKGRFNI